MTMDAEAWKAWSGKVNRDLRTLKKRLTGLETWFVGDKDGCPVIERFFQELIDDGDDAVRKEMGLPVAKRRYRVPATVMELSATEYRNLMERL